MKISKIEFENFRNFRDHGEIRCSTDGKATIIYGKNGDGKTTLHQLFQWVFYGQVHFNKTTTDRLYNLQYESERSLGDCFDVMGRIDFEHNGSQYSITRVFNYKKDINDSQKIGDDFTLSKMDDDNNWRRIDRPKDTIEKLLPPGLSDYFFFDGESMIADLRVKGRDSAGKLRKALYSMFDLDILESAIAHIGRTDLKTTVLGKLYLSKGTMSGSNEVAQINAQLKSAMSKLESISADLDASEKKKSDLQILINDVSEKIGSNISKSEYERKRKDLKSQRDQFLKNAAGAQIDFGDKVIDMFPYLLIAKATEKAKGKIQIKPEKTNYPAGITKQLVDYLLSGKTDTCICGNPLCDAEREHIKSMLHVLPPYDYAKLYHDFCQMTDRWSRSYDTSRLGKYILDVLDNNENASLNDKKIQELDEEEKKRPDVEDLIVARKNAEYSIRELENKILQLNRDKQVYEARRKKLMKELDAATLANASCIHISHQIEIMEKVLAHFQEKLDKESKEFSEKLQDNIQKLLNEMLTSKRKVSVSPEFAVRVTDSFDDESKSEGQFAVVSFAYIGGILKMLRSQKGLSTKEYPLVLDGPFSKLDPDQRANVVNLIPQFAPQVILFSKDELNDVFSPDMIGNVWTIISNDEKNVARVEEGYLWK